MTIQHAATDNIVCPWCGFGWTPSAYLLEYLDHSGEGFVPEICEKCGKTYEIKMRAQRTYITTNTEEG